MKKVKVRVDWGKIVDFKAFCDGNGIEYKQWPAPKNVFSCIENPLFKTLCYIEVEDFGRVVLG